MNKDFVMVGICRKATWIIIWMMVDIKMTIKIMMLLFIVWITLKWFALMQLCSAYYANTTSMCSHSGFLQSDLNYFKAISCCLGTSMEMTIKIAFDIQCSCK